MSRRSCERCGGYGYTDADGEDECPDCKGSGVVVGRLVAVTYRRRRNADADSHEALSVWINGALAGRLTVRVATERALLDVLAEALDEAGAKAVS